MARPIAFVTFAMFIIDEIDYGDEKISQANLIGGAGVYAALGARMAAGSEYSSSVSWIVDVGSDFPSEFKLLIDSWHTSCVFRVDKSRLTTRAWNGYGPNEHRLFKYLTPKIRLEVPSLNDQQALSSSFHMVCSPFRCIELANNLKSRRLSIDQTCPKPIIIWEPIPDLCTPEEVQNLQRAAQEVSIVSPNADELASVFTNQAHLSRNDMIRRFMGWENGRASSTHAIIREGSNGSTIYFAPTSFPKHDFADTDLPHVHLPAFHTKAQASKVIDPTGGGNTYLGALAIGMTTLLEGNTVTDTIYQKLPSLRMESEEMNAVRHVLISALYAVIAASYAIEQCGVPSLQATTSDAQAQADTWNGSSFIDRMTDYLERETDHLRPQLAQIK